MTSRSQRDVSGPRPTHPAAARGPVIRADLLVWKQPDEHPAEALAFAAIRGLEVAGRRPTIRKIAEVLGSSRNHLRPRLEALEARGDIAPPETRCGGWSTVRDALEARQRLPGICELPHWLRSITKLEAAALLVAGWIHRVDRRLGECYASAATIGRQLGMHPSRVDEQLDILEWCGVLGQGVASCSKSARRRWIQRPDPATAAVTGQVRRQARRRQARAVAPIAGRVSTSSDGTDCREVSGADRRDVVAPIAGTTRVPEGHQRSEAAADSPLPGSERTNSLPENAPEWMAARRPEPTLTPCTAAPSSRGDSPLRGTGSGAPISIGDAMRLQQLQEDLQGLSEPERAVAEALADRGVRKFANICRRIVAAGGGVEDVALLFRLAERRDTRGTPAAWLAANTREPGAVEGLLHRARNTCARGPSVLELATKPAKRTAPATRDPEMGKKSEADDIPEAPPVVEPTASTPADATEPEAAPQTIAAALGQLGLRFPRPAAAKLEDAGATFGDVALIAQLARSRAPDGQLAQWIVRELRDPESLLVEARAAAAPSSVAEVDPPAANIHYASARLSSRSVLVDIAERWPRWPPGPAEQVAERLRGAIEDTGTMLADLETLRAELEDTGDLANADRMAGPFRELLAEAEHYLERLAGS